MGEVVNKNKIIIAFAVIAAGAVTWRHGMAMEQQGAPAGAGQVRIFKTKNNESVEVPEDRLILFGTINDLLIDATEGSDIPVAQFSSAALKKIVGDLDWVLHDVMPNMNENVDERDAARTVVRAMPQVQYSNSTELYLAIEALNAADFLNQPSLVERYAREIADMAMSGGAMQLLAQGDDQYGAILSQLRDNMQNAILYYTYFWTLQHNNWTSSVAISADGNTVVSGSEDKTTKIAKWNGTTWVEQHTIHENDINSVAISADGNTVVIGLKSGTAKIVAWDGNSWTVQYTIEHDDAVLSVAISANGKTVATGCVDRTIQIVKRNGNTWTVPHMIHDNLEMDNDAVKPVAISADGKTVVMGSEDTAAKILEWEDNAWIEQYTIPHDDSVYSVAISANGKTVATGSMDGAAKIVTREGNTWTVPHVIDHGDNVNSVAISADGNTVVTGSWDHTAKIVIRKNNTWTVQYTIEHDDPVESVAISADGNRVVTGSWDNTAKIVTWDGNAWGQHVIHHDDAIISVAISKDGALVVTGSADHTTKISLCLPKSLRGISDFDTCFFERLLWWAKGSGQEIAKTGWAKNTLDHILWNAVNFVDKKILQTWIRETMEEVGNQGTRQMSGRKHALDQTGQGSTKRMNANENQRNEARAAARAMQQVQFSKPADLYQAIETLNATDFSNQPLLVEQYARKVADMMMSGGAMRLLAQGDKQYRALLNKLNDNTQNAILYYMPDFWTVRHNSWINSVAISADGKTAVTGSYGKTAKIVKWNGNTWTEHTIRHDAAVGSVAISPDGNTIVTGSDDKTAKIVKWKDNAWIEQHTIMHDDTVCSVAISADGKTVVTGSWDKTAKIVEWKNNAWVEQHTITHNDIVWSVAISTDTVVTGSNDGTTKIVRKDNTWTELHTIEHDPVTSVAISVDGNTVVMGFAWNTAMILAWDGSRWAEHVIDHDAGVNSVAISADGNTVVTGSGDKTAKIVTRKDNTWTDQHTIRHNDIVWSVAISADGNTVVTGSADKMAKIMTWDGNTWRQQHVIHHDDSVNSVAISKDGALVMTGSRDKTAKISLCLPKSLRGISDFDTRLFEHLLWWAKGSEQKIAKTGWAKNTLDHIRWNAVNFVDKKILQAWIRETMEEVSNSNNQRTPQVSGSKHALGQAGEGSTKRWKESED